MDDCYVIQIIGGAQQAETLWKAPFDTVAEAENFAALFPTGMNLRIVRVFEAAEIVKEIKGGQRL